MKLPSGQEVKNETLSEIADRITIEMLVTEELYVDSYSMVDAELENGYECGYETLPGLDVNDREFLLEVLRIPTLEYFKRLRLARSNQFIFSLKDKDWSKEIVDPECPNCGEILHEVHHARSVKLEWTNDKWIESDVHSSGFSCPRCNQDITEEELDNIGRPYCQE